MTGRDRRRVRHLRLRAPEEALVRRGAALLEDVLRTATLPGEDGRLLVVRSFDVGPIAAGAPPQRLALAVEERFRRVGAAARPATAPGAGAGPAVRFADEAEPYRLLALRLARGEPVTEWFWPLAVPGWRPDLPRPAALRLTLAGALDTRAGAGAALALLDALHAGGGLAPLLAALRPGDGAALLAAFGWLGTSAAVPPTLSPARPSVEAMPGSDTPTGNEGGHAGPPLRAADPTRTGVAHNRRIADEAKGAAPVPATSWSNEEAAPATWHPILRDWSGRWGANDDRTHWLATVALASSRPHTLADPRLPDRGRALLRAVAPPPRGESPEPARPSAVPTPRSGPTAPDDPRPDNHPARSADPSQPTVAAGLLFLVPILEHLGIADLLAAYPALTDLDLPTRLLRAQARRLRIPANDPILASLPPLPPGVPPDPGPWSAPGAWRAGIAARGRPRLRRLSEPITGTGRGGHCRGSADHAHEDGLPPPSLNSGTQNWGEGGLGGKGGRPAPPTWTLLDASTHLPLATWHDQPPPDAVPWLDGALPLSDAAPLHISPFALLLAAWLRAADRWRRAHTDLRLDELVRRRGQVAATPTHLDVLMDLRDADARVRRAGLDLDPGWVPWLGRVVTFHYR